MIINPLILRIFEKIAGRNYHGMVKFHDFTIFYPNLHVFLGEYKYIFSREIYKFNSEKKSPCIIDGGGYIGLSALYFKKKYPDSKITVFEPDPVNIDFIEKNLKYNRLRGIVLIPAALDDREGEVLFTSGADGGQVSENGPVKVRMVKLSNHVNEAVDFLKLNIEGSESAVLKDLENSGKIDLINEMCVEWHSFPGRKQNLGDLLSILERNGFRYLVNDFDYSTNPQLKPPFQIKNKNYYLLIYAKRQSFQKNIF